MENVVPYIIDFFYFITLLLKVIKIYIKMNSNKRSFDTSFDDSLNDENQFKKVKSVPSEIIFLIQNDNHTLTQFGGIKSFHLEEFGDLIYYQTLKTSIRYIQKKYVKAYKDVNSDSWNYF